MARAVIRPTRNPVNGPGPTPTAMPVRSDAELLGVSENASDPWRQQLTVPARVDDRARRQHLSAVMHRDGHRRCRRVEGEEQHTQERNRLRR